VAKLILTRKTVETGDVMDESYDASALTHPDYFGRRHKELIAATTQEEAEAWAIAVIAWFNSTAPPGGTHRELVSVRLEEAQ